MTLGCTACGKVVLGGTKPQVEQAVRRKPVSIILPLSLLSVSIPPNSLPTCVPALATHDNEC